ncbi:MAG: hypothetical protein ACOYM4_11660 [Nodosilinea sp.]
MEFSKKRSPPPTLKATPSARREQPWVDDIWATFHPRNAIYTN